MKLPSLKVVALTPIIAFLAFYTLGALLVQTRDQEELPAVPSLEFPLEVAILGASGTAGDGILKAALASNAIGKIHIITRRVTPRIQQGIDSGKVELTLHQNYLDYSNAIGQLLSVDAVYWAIGISSLGADEKTYGMIHVDFPMQFVKAWAEVSNNPNPSFHFISSSDISEDSDTMWVRQKIRSEKVLFKLGEETSIRVIAYRPDYIGSTAEQAGLRQKMLFWFFRPVGAAVKALEIGRAMIDLTLRPKKIENGLKLNTREIITHGRE